ALDRAPDAAVDPLLPLVEGRLRRLDPLAQRGQALLARRAGVGRGVLERLLAVAVVVARVGRRDLGAVGVALAGQDALHAPLGLGEPLAAVLDDVAHRAEREEAALLLLLLEDDLRERDRGEVFLRLVVDDLDLVTIAD